MPKKKVPNPNGREGEPISIPIPFDEAVRIALEVKPEPGPPRHAKKRKTKR